MQTDTGDGESRIAALIAAALDAAGDAEHELGKTPEADRSTPEWAVGIHLGAALRSLRDAAVHASEIPAAPRASDPDRYDTDRADTAHEANDDIGGEP